MFVDVFGLFVFKRKVDKYYLISVYLEKCLLLNSVAVGPGLKKTIRNYLVFWLLFGYNTSIILKSQITFKEGMKFLCLSEGDMG